MIGQGTSGIGMNIVKWVLLSLFKDLYTLTLIFCGIAALICLFCCVLYNVLIQNKFYNEYLEFNLKGTETTITDRIRSNDSVSSVEKIDLIQSEIG